MVYQQQQLPNVSEETLEEAKQELKAKMTALETGSEASSTVAGEVDLLSCTEEEYLIMESAANLIQYTVRKKLPTLVLALGSKKYTITITEGTINES